MFLENRVGVKIITVLLSLVADLFQQWRSVKSLVSLQTVFNTL
jgi:hypothetical protein